MRDVLAGGAVVTRVNQTRGTEVVIIHRQRYNDWSLPKGKLDPGEPIPAAAVREVMEETGVTIRLGAPLDTVRYNAGKNGMKRVSYWTGTVLDVIPRAPDEEVDVVSWLPIKAALARLTRDHDRMLLQQAMEQPATTPLIIIRHGKAMDRKDWSHPDPARPISARGRREAVGLIPILKAYGVTELISSTSARCVSTLLPYAQRQNLVIERRGLLSEEEGGEDEKGVQRLMRSIAAQAAESGQPTAVCGHRPVLPQMLAALDIVPRPMAPGECIVAHLTADGATHAMEHYRPQA
ncbi:NUDIX hydrolase [Microlunatus panaciterrae]|uniref:8-oxo-dGTP diphosphatase n=1 Tax=Microlunatus panaciterrae TaxID=400768 RepID=A0ABS2RHA7_9ACTN|nr:NUDIX domain-containing protein [Microlunatus panaciterrae]MBM7798347.1 8-oxo-dGTP diphosphatase [Microlunatus panaciterrae]